MKKYTLLGTVLLLALTVSLAACSPVPSAPAAEPTAAPAPATPAPPATEAVALTVEPAAAPDDRPVVPAPVEGQRPLADVAPQDRNDRFSGPAAKFVEDDTIYTATIVTNKGTIIAELYQDTPEGLNNFVTLALNGFYDGLTFHRVEPGFVIQGGDPLGAGDGGPGYTIPAEILHSHLRGALAWARTGDEINPERRSSGSQFYITLDDTDFLDGAYSVFGFVIEGMDVVDQIAMGDQIERIDVTTGMVSLIPTPGPTATPTPSPTPYAPSAAEGRPLAQLPLNERTGVYNTAPEITIDVAKTYQATIATDKGDIVIDLDAKAAPMTVNNFVMLANLGYYDGMPIAFNDPGAYLVTGSPEMSPDSDAGYAFALEPAAVASDIVTGTLSMWAVADPVTFEPVASGSQVMVWRVIVPDNPGYFNSFGKVVEGMDVVDSLQIEDVIKTITVTEK